MNTISVAKSFVFEMARMRTDSNFGNGNSTLVSIFHEILTAMLILGYEQRTRRIRCQWCDQPLEKFRLEMS